MKRKPADHLGFSLSIDKSSPVSEAFSNLFFFFFEVEKLSPLNGALTPERMALIQQRIASNFYDQDEVLETVAERILNNKDLRKFRS